MAILFIYQLFVHGHLIKIIVSLLLILSHRIVSVIQLFTNFDFVIKKRITFQIIKAMQTKRKKIRLN